MSEEEDFKITPTAYTQKRSNKRGGKNRPSVLDKLSEKKKALAELNVHLPRSLSSALRLKNMRELKEMLRESWAAHRDKLNGFAMFSQKQMRFARNYARNGRTNKVGAMREAGYESSNPVVLLEMANRYLKQANFLELVKSMELEEKAKMKVNVEDVTKWFTDIAQASFDAGDFTNANRSMENLAKYLGMFIDKKEVTHVLVHNREELDQRILVLNQVLQESAAEIDAKLLTS